MIVSMKHPHASLVHGQPRSERRGYLPRLRYRIAFLLTLGFALIAFTPTASPTGSMRPTIDCNEFVLVDRITHHLHPIERGDVVAAQVEGHDGKSMAGKRVVAVGGDTVEITKPGVLMVNGKRSPYNWDGQLSKKSHAPLTVAKGHLYLIGDNRAFTLSYENVPEGNVRGRVRQLPQLLHALAGRMPNNYAHAADDMDSSGCLSEVVS